LLHLFPKAPGLFLAPLTLFLHLPNGFRNADLRARMLDLLGVTCQQYSAGRMTYDLRRLRLKGFMVRRHGSSRYFITPYGMRMAIFFTRVNARLFRPGLAALDPVEQANVPHPLRDALAEVNDQIDIILEPSCLKCA
jgi:hypothetical protein